MRRILFVDNGRQLSQSCLRGRCAYSGDLVTEYHINHVGANKPYLVNFYFPSVIEQLGNAGVSWKYYSGRDPVTVNSLEFLARVQEIS